MGILHNVNVDRIKALAKTQGLTMTYLCSLFGKRATFLSDVRLGKDHIDENELSIIADKLNTTVEYLTGQTDDPACPDEKKPAAETGDELKENTIRIVGRDGSYIEKTLTDEQIQALRTMLDALPDANDL